MKLQKAGLFIRLTAVLLCLAGCSNVIASDHADSCSANVDSLNCQNGMASGVAYALPKGQVLLTWSRTQTSASDLQKAQTTLATAQQSLGKDQSALAAARAKNPSDPTLPALQAQVNSDQTSVDAATTGLTAAQAAQGSYTETASLTVLPVVPDPDPAAHFVANLWHSELRNDNLSLGVTNGLLNSATATSADQTPSIITTLANTGITLAAFVGSGGLAGPALAGGAPRAAVRPPPPSCQAATFSTVFDPANAGEAQTAQAALAGYTRNIVLKLQSAAAPAAPSAPGTDTRVDGLVYRAMTAVTLTLAPDTSPVPGCKLASPVVAQSIVAVVPDTNTDYIVPAHAGYFTTSTFNFAFTNGTVTSYSNQQPSEIAVAAGIPLTIIQSVMSIPTQILQLRVNYDTAATALVNAKSQLTIAQQSALTAAATAQTQLVQAQTALTQAEDATGAARPSGQAAVIAAQTNLINAQAAAITAEQTLAADAAAASAAH